MIIWVTFDAEMSLLYVQSQMTDYLGYNYMYMHVPNYSSPTLQAMAQSHSSLLNQQ